MLTNQVLLFDADDTLWENNVYFDRAIAGFISYLDHRTHTAAEVHEHLSQCERVTIATHGYGLKSFRRSLMNCFEQLADRAMTSEVHARIVAFTEAIATQEVELLPKVEATLRQLASSHRLLLVTKGDAEEQLDKVARSGLRDLFEAAEVPAEKHEDVYRELTARYRCELNRTWMIGNSPKSDINPSLAAGLNAGYIPHHSTWILEHEPVQSPQAPQRLLQLHSFGELLLHFS